MNNPWQPMCIALAGVAQAVFRVNELATSGYLNTLDFETAVNSLFAQNSDSPLDIFGGDIENLRTGLETLIKLIESPRETQLNRQVLGYCLGVFHLQKKLSGTPAMANSVSEGLAQCRQKRDHFGPTHDNVLASLADLYSNTISTFQFRIQVMGEYQYLQQDRVANQVRVLLFAAIRAATLWRQLGGARWQLLIHKRKILAATRELLHTLPGHHLH